MSLTPAYFDRHRGAAMGIVLAGAGIGGLVLSPVIHTLLDKVGIRWTLRILGIWNFLVGIPVASVMKVKHPAARGQRQTRMSMALMKRGTFILQVRNLVIFVIVHYSKSVSTQSSGAFLQAAGNMVPIYFLTTYSVSVLSYSSSTGSLLLAVNNAVNSISRIAMGFLADRVGRQNTMVLSVRFGYPLCRTSI